MRSTPQDKYDKEELKDLNAQSWMVKTLKLNPEYVYWGNYEDYMISKGQWDSPVELSTVSDLWELNELNELVNFYFNITRKSKNCESCDRSGYNKETKQISDDYYDFNNTGRRWVNKLTEDEIVALAKYRHLTIEEARKRASNNGLSGCDALDRHMLIEVRAKRLGVYGLCEKCNGKGYIYTEPVAKLQLQMWFIHPRKGASRGVLLTNIEENELSKVKDYLREARQRNHDRFSKI